MKQNRLLCDLKKKPWKCYHALDYQSLISGSTGLSKEICIIAAQSFANLQVDKVLKKLTVSQNSMKSTHAYFWRAATWATRIYNISFKGPNWSIIGNC